jgi:ketosteroid isomerase-like protein
VSRPPVAVTISFLDCINRGDLDGLVDLMSDDHSLEVITETPLTGRDDNEEAWYSYFNSFPNYVIYPRRICEETPGVVAVLGHTTGSHLELPDEDEVKLTLIWVAHVVDGLVTRWRLVEDSIGARREFGFID